MGPYKRVGGSLMRTYLTSQRLVTKLQMLRSGKKKKAFVVVEGVTDYRVYGKLFDLENCEIVIGESKENVVEAIKICETQKLEGIIGIVDADFWRLTGVSFEWPKTLFMTDDHDLECMMLRSKAYEHVLLEYGDVNKIARFEGKKHQTIKEGMLRNVSLIGYLRKISLEQHLDLRFNQLDFLEFTDLSTLDIKEEVLIKYILFHSRKQSDYKEVQVKKWLEVAMQEAEDGWQICCGHDLMEFITLGFIHLYGNYNAKKLFAGQLEGSFRLAYHEKMFQGTELYQRLLEWEKANIGYHLFQNLEIDEAM